MKRIKWLMTVWLVLGLLFANTTVWAEVQGPSAKPVLQDDDDGDRETYRGTVKAVGEASLTLSRSGDDDRDRAQSEGGSMTFAVTSATKISVPGLDHPATLADVKVGAPATVIAERTRERSWVALEIRVSADKPRKVQVTGLVTEYLPNTSLTVQTRDGTSHRLLITPETKIAPERWANLLAVGARVRVIALRSSGNTQLIAWRITIISRPPRTATPVPTMATSIPTMTTTALPPTATRTQPAATMTPSPVTPGPTNTPPPATVTSTSVAPTATQTSAPPTVTNTSLPPTATATRTAPPPTATNTAVPPTATHTAPPPTVTSAPVTWNNTIGPMFAAQCTMCHGSAGGLSLATYQAALTGGRGGPGIVPGSPSTSEVVIVQQRGGHPGQLNATNLATVIAWIQAGAPER